MVWQWASQQLAKTSFSLRKLCCGQPGKIRADCAVKQAAIPRQVAMYASATKCIEGRLNEISMCARNRLVAHSLTGRLKRRAKISAMYDYSA